MYKNVLFVLFALLTLCSTKAVAQESAVAEEYYVYEVRGDVKTGKVNNESAVKVYQKLDEMQILRVSQDAMVRIFDKAGKKIYTINQKCAGKVKDLIAADGCTFLDLTTRYFNFVWDKICKNRDKVEDSGTMVKTTGTYRDVDSLLIDALDNQSVPVDSVPCCKK
ncbi:MAG: hypothetical protein Q4E59_04950 [Bacteroidales bacterium]|nr:hypothetical protein [Bacteroidales bacterium]